MHVIVGLQCTRLVVALVAQEEALVSTVRQVVHQHPVKVKKCT
jgi:hypothetical protein